MAPVPLVQVCFKNERNPVLCPVLVSVVNDMELGDWNLVMITSTLECEFSAIELQVDSGDGIWNCIQPLETQTDVECSSSPRRTARAMGGSNLFASCQQNLRKDIEMEPYRLHSYFARDSKLGQIHVDGIFSQVRCPNP